VAHNDGCPLVLDPFAGGGAIPLEAGRLGAKAVANDYNPVAHMILRATCEYPQKYGKPAKRQVCMEEFGRTVQSEVDVPNVLAHDFEYWAMRLFRNVQDNIGALYPCGKDGCPVLAYLWARTVPCSNPSCRATFPLLRSLVLRSKGSRVALSMEIVKSKKEIQFGIVRGQAISRTEGTKAQRGPAKCPFCGETTSEDDIRRAATEG
jgi:adenine-specific DNA methylase